MKRPPRSQRGMPVALFKLPRARGDMDSEAESRLFAKRCFAAFYAVYLALLVWGISKVLS